MEVLNVSGYRFTPLDELRSKRDRLRRDTRALGLRGTVLLAEEGINCFLAGSREQIDAFRQVAFGELGIPEVTFKESWSPKQPFRRMLVKIKREIIPLGRPEINPGRRPAPFVAARELKRWLDEGRPVVLLDTRNDYEVKVGTFRGAVDPDVRTFRKFPQAIAELERNLPDLRNRTVVTFCTGGIRCEKAAPYLAQQGFRDVYQLEGGILKYFEECGDAHYDGNCFVFDQRVALNGRLETAEFKQCFRCREPLNLEDQASPHYRLNESCPYCFGKQIGAASDLSADPLEP
ncbi:MAG: sulfurtransferase [Bacteriovoracia bacterium]